MSGSILVLGGTGHVGTPLVAALAAKGETVKVGSRKGTAAAGATGVRVDLTDPSTFADAFADVDRAYVLAPGGTVDVVSLLKPVIDFAAARGVKIVLQTAKGVDADDNIPFRKVERLVEASGSAYVILRPDWFADNFHTYWLGGVRAGVIQVPAGEGKSGFIDVRDIAASAAAALTTDRFDGKAYVLTGPEALSYAEAAAILSRAIGRPVAYEAISPEAFVAQLTGFGVPQDYAQFLAAIYHVVAQGWGAGLTGDVELLTGRRPIPLATYAADHKADLSA